MAALLTGPTTKNCPHMVKSTEECDHAFLGLKQKLCSAPVLRNQDFHLPFVLHTDAASNRGDGIILTQYYENGEDHPVVKVPSKSRRKGM